MSEEKAREAADIVEGGKAAGRGVRGGKRAEVSEFESELSRSGSGFSSNPALFIDEDNQSWRRHRHRIIIRTFSNI